VLGPTAGLVLADLGAEVIKIERTPDGDPTRYLKGFGMGYFPFFNRNKKSLVADLKSSEGKEIVERLLEGADVLIENYAPGTMDRLGFGYRALAPRFPKLIYCSLKGFLEGPYEKRTALDEVVQMMSGLAYMTGPPGQPLRAGASVVDIMTGLCGAMGVLLALMERKETGRGQLTKTALFETAAFVMAHHMAYQVVAGAPPPPMPARISPWAIYHQFRTLEGQIIFIGVTSDKQWPRFCRAFDRLDLLEDKRLQTNNDRVADHERLIPDLEAMLATMPLEEAVHRCEEAEIPFSPVARPEDLFNDPQLNLGGSLLDTTFPGGQTTKMPKLPLSLGDHLWTLRQDPPLVGQHTLEVLAHLGYDSDEIRSLHERGIVVSPEGTAKGADRG
jgi:crotonobetainyl-CoA:carnitine CoA-transferase CaiB-like acyl-CoA transferase